MALAKGSVFVADVSGPAGPVGQWPETVLLLSTANLHTIKSGAYCPISPIAATAMGLPTANYGTIIKYEWDNAGTLQWIPATSRGNEVWQKVKTGSSWGSWGRIDNAVQVLVSSDDIDDLTDGTYTPISNTAATALGLPSANVGPLTQYSQGGNRQQTWTPISSDPRIYIRSRISGNWTAWSVITPGGGGGGASGGGVEREMRLAQANARRGGVYGTNSVAVFALMFDHGTNNFIAKVLPLLKKYNFPCGLGLNSRMYESSYLFASSDDQTTFAQIQTEALRNGVTIWNHGQKHNAGGATEIIGGRDELTASLPKITIENWLHTGTYGDFESGSDFPKYWENTIGSTIMNGHAYLTGDIQEPIKPLSGQPKPGYDGTWVDSGQSALDILKSQIQDAQKTGGGVMMRQHPMYLDSGSYLSTTQLDTFLGWVAGERDAGRLLVLTPDLLNLADAGRSERRNLLDGAGGAGTQSRTVDLVRNALACGSVNEIQSTVKVTGAGTVILKATTSGLSKTATINVPSGAWVDVRTFFTIPKDGTGTLTVSIEAGTATGLTSQQLNIFPG